MSNLNRYENYQSSKISEEQVKSFLNDILEIFKEDINEREKKKALQKTLRKKFWIENIKKEDLDNLYVYIGENEYSINCSLGNAFSVVSVKNLDFWYLVKELNKILRLSNKLEKLHEVKLKNVKNEILEKLNNYFEDKIDNHQIKSILSKIENYIGKISPEEIEVKQIILQESGDEHIILPLVVKVNGHLLDIDVFLKKDGNQIVDSWITPADNLHGWDKKSTLIIQKLYQNEEAWVEIKKDYKLDENKFNLEDGKERKYTNNRWEELKQVNFSDKIRDKVKEWEYDEWLRVLISVTKEWNKIFKKNREELENAKTEEEKRKIIEKNAQAITDLFANNATLQWTMDFDNSFGEDGIKWYFLHFLALKPTMRFSQINKVKTLEENRLMIVQWDYDFTTVDENGNKKLVEANFMFTLQKNSQTAKWAILRLKSTYEKTENMFDKLS